MLACTNITTQIPHPPHPHPLTKLYRKILTVYNLEKK